MKIVWLTNLILPQIAAREGQTPDPYGGWLVSLCDDLLSAGSALTVCYPAPVGAQASGGDGTFRYRSFPASALAYAPETEERFYRLLTEERPEVIHVWGVEFPHALAMVNAAERAGLLDRLVVSIQGLCSACADAYEAGLPERTVRARTLRDRLRHDGVREQQQKYVLRGAFEVRALEKARHVIGRTAWDRAEAARINPKLTYRACNETLRESFYQNRWQLDACARQTLFVSQCAPPLKGFHVALTALARLKDAYPEARLFTTGTDPRTVPWYRVGAYQRYQAERIKSLGLDGRVRYLGRLDEREMCAQYCKSHVFLCPSSLENSPNSVGEAMLLGVPVIASRVGGVPSVMAGEPEGLLVPFGEPDALAGAIARVFSDDALALRLSEAERARALQTHDRERNFSELMKIYSVLAGAEGNG